MIQILYTQDHADRGRALAQAIPGAQHGLVSTTPSAKTGLDTLIFWGHGTIFSLCDLQAPAIGKLIGNWKKLNSSLKTVEIITCNSRHAPAGHDPFVSKVKSELRSGFLSSTRNIVIKAMPTHVGGSLNAFSILLAHAPNNSWCYITAPGPTDATLMGASNTVKAEAKKYGYDLAQGSDRVGRDVKDRTFTVNYGYFNTLRAQLGVVH